jgi:hypothetical protein
VTGLVDKTKNLINKIKEYYEKREYESPFYMKAQKCGHIVPKTSKMDDISIIMA